MNFFRSLFGRSPERDPDDVDARIERELAHHARFYGARYLPWGTYSSIARAVGTNRMRVSRVAGALGYRIASDG